MKNIVKVLVVLCCMFTVTTTFAQKFGHLNSIELLNSMSEWKAAEKNLENYVSQLERQIKTKEEALVNDVNSIRKQINEGLLTPNQIKQKEQDIQKRTEALEKEKLKAQQDVVRKEQELTQPIQKRVLTAIESVAKENGYSYIFDIGLGGSILYYDASKDVTSLVKAKL